MARQYPNGGGGPAPRMIARQDGDCLVVALAGDWTTGTISREDRDLAAVAPNGAKRARLELDDLGEVDTTGAWLVYRTARELRSRGLEVDLAGGRQEQRDLIATVGAHDVPCPGPPRPANPLVTLLLRLGRATFEVLAEGRDMVNFLGHTTVVFIRSLLRPSTIRVTPLISHMEQAGLNALPIVGLMSFLIGMVLAYQGADQLARFGAQIFTVNLVGYGVLREMGILLTAIIVAGRSGSAFTAQIGTMKVNEEVDALRAIGVDPMAVLVMPRVFALVLVLPLLTFYADVMGLLGGAVTASVELDISFYQFARQLSTEVPIWSFWVGIIKAPFFAFIIAMVGCFEGFMVSRSAESVGRRTTRAVVEAIFLVIVLDALASILFSHLGV
jgi:phospholipid/cholesterol/gamma-HCH transport system permease protein